VRMLHAQNLHHTVACRLHVEQRLRAVVQRNTVAPLACDSEATSVSATPRNAAGGRQLRRCQLIRS